MLASTSAGSPDPIASKCRQAVVQSGQGIGVGVLPQGLLEQGFGQGEADGAAEAGHLPEAIGPASDLQRAQGGVGVGTALGCRLDGLALIEADTAGVEHEADQLGQGGQIEVVTPLEFGEAEGTLRQAGFNGGVERVVGRDLAEIAAVEVGVLRWGLLQPEAPRLTGYTGGAGG